MYSPAKAGAIINSCVVLHNILIQNKYPIEDVNLDIDEDTEENFEEPITNNVGNNQVRGNVIREHLIQTFF